MTTHERVTWWAPPVLVLLACTGESTLTETATTVVDSAGIEVVSHPGDPFTGRADALERVVSHGRGPLDYSFDRPVDGALMANGDIVVADIGTSEVVRVAADGSSHTVLAQAGEGPGEVRAPISVLRLGPDSVLIEDDGNSKFVVLHGGDVVRVSSVADRGTLAHGLRTHAVAPDGRLFMGTSSYMPDGPGGWIMGQMVVVDPRTLSADTVAPFEMARSLERGGLLNPFAPFGQVSASNAGFVQGRSDLPELVWRTANGSVYRIVRWAPARAFPDESHLADVIQAYREALPRLNRGIPDENVETLVQQRRQRLRLERDTPLPLYVELMDHGTDGVWLAQFEAGVVGRAGAMAYMVVSNDGRSMRRVDFPAGIRVLDVAYGLVLGVSRDDLDVEHVVVYRLEAHPRAERE